MTEQTVNLLPLVHRQDIPTPEALLEQALPDIVASVPNAIRAQVYRLAWGGMAVWFSVDGDAVPGTFYPIEEDTSYHQTVNTGEPTIDEQQNLLIAPLRGRYGTIFGLLTVKCNEQPTNPHILDALAEQLSSAIYGKQLEQLLERQIVLTSQFNQADTLEEIAGIFAKNSAIKSQFVAINAFDYAADGTVQGAQAVVTANREDTFHVDDDIEVNLDYLQLVYETFTKGEDFLVSDVATDTRFSTSAQEWLKSRKARSIYCLPLTIQNKLHGFITLIDTTRALAPTPLEKQIYKNIAEQAATVIEKRNLLEQQEEQAFFLALLNNLMQEANVAQDEASLLQETSKVLHDVMGHDWVAIGLIDEYGATNTIVASFPTTESVGTQMAVEHDEVSKRLKETGRSVVISDVSNDEALAGNREMLEQLGIKSVLFVPMFDTEGLLLGAVGIGSKTSGNAFEQQSISAAETIISQIVVNIQKIRLLRNSQQQATQLQQIADFGQAMQASLQLEEILKTSLSYGQMVLAADYVNVMLYDRNIHGLRQSALFWEDKSQVTLPGILIEKEADTIAQKVWEDQSLIHLDEVQADWEWKHPLITTLHSIMVAPLMAGGVLRGILEIGSLHSQAFSSTDVAAFRQMTNQLSVAIDNAETYSQSQRLARNKVQANEIIAQIQQQPDINAILNVTARELGKALGAKRARIRLGMNVKGSSGD